MVRYGRVPGPCFPCLVFHFQVPGIIRTLLGTTACGQQSVFVDHTPPDATTSPVGNDHSARISLDAI